MSELYAFLARGGLLMIPIGLSSVVGLAFFIERLWGLQRQKILPPRFLEVASRLLQARRLPEAEALCHRSDSPIAAILAEGLRYAGRDRELIKEVMEEAGRQELFRMERFTNAMGSIATVTPLMGLLGTVVGLIQMFQRVVGSAEASQSMIDVGLLANGIWQALITTAAGLSVAIPVFLAYRFTLSRIDGYATEMEDVSRNAIELLVAPHQAPVTSRAELAAEIAASASAAEDKQADKQADKAKDDEAVTRAEPGDAP